MLLNEIIAKFAPVENDPRGQRRFTPDIERSNTELNIGGRILNVRLTKEEYQRFKRIFKQNAIANNIKDPDKIVDLEMNNLQNTLKEVYVVYPYHIDSDPGIFSRMLRDALKMRKPHNPQDPQSFIDQSDYTQMVKAGVNRFKDWNDPEKSKTFKGLKKTRMIIDDFANVISSPQPIVIIPLASSSPAAKTIAKVLAQEIGSNAKILPSFSKSPFRQSRYNMPNFTEKNRSYQAFHRTLANAKYTLKSLLQQEDEINSRTDLSSDSKKIMLGRINNLKSRARATIDRLSNDNTGYSMKSLYGVPGSKEQFYGGQTLDPMIKSELHDAIVILVDDNIAKGTTINNAIKEIYLQGIRPTKIVGFALHRLEQS